ncbi:hypothetical protein G8759_27370 [Spirosoma aureum]|uniref:Uncharacterized protein n=1 Tax=Spirosoma aureum TaxID=2692134 RepID=A0A6G9AUL3_9BACT|nr:hypothetical protein [Spirosoma aureum]QIP16090.1 hypothetical protein G8759_27370 [Spirosoma aureum]
MANRNAFRSLRTMLVAVTIIGCFTTACKKSSSGSDVDPRDQYVGTYDGGDKGYQSIITVGAVTFNPEYGTASIVVTKGSNPKELYIESGQQSYKVTAELDGANFTVIDKSSSQIFIPPSNTYTGTYKATGVFGVDQASGKNAIAITATTETLKDGSSIRKTEIYTGSRK